MTNFRLSTPFAVALLTACGGTPSGEESAADAILPGQVSVQAAPSLSLLGPTCLPPAGYHPAARAAGAPCAYHDDCLGGVCVRSGRTAGYCAGFGVTTCATYGAGWRPVLTSICGDSSTAQPVCVRSAAAAAGCRGSCPTGATCRDNNDCSGWCYVAERSLGGAGVCLPEPDARTYACPAGYDYASTEATELRPACLPSAH